MKTTGKVGLLVCLGLALSSIGYYGYSRNVNYTTDLAACGSIDRDRVAQIVQNDLLNKSDTEFFGKMRITIGDLYLHPAELDKTTTHVLIPFTIKSRRANGGGEFVGSVRCGDLSVINYKKA